MLHFERNITCASASMATTKKNCCPPLQKRAPRTHTFSEPCPQNCNRVSSRSGNASLISSTRSLLERSPGCIQRTRRCCLQMPTPTLNSAWTMSALRPIRRVQLHMFSLLCGRLFTGGSSDVQTLWLPRGSWGCKIARPGLQTFGASSLSSCDTTSHSHSCRAW